MGCRHSTTDGPDGGSKVKDEGKLLPPSSLSPSGSSSYMDNLPDVPTPAIHVDLLLPCTPFAIASSPSHWEKILNYEAMMTKFLQGTGELIQLTVRCHAQETVFFKRLCTGGTDPKPKAKQVVIATVSNPENGTNWGSSILKTVYSMLTEQFDQDDYEIIIKHDIKNHS